MSLKFDDVRVSVCLCVTLRSKLDRLRNELWSFTSSKYAKNTVFTHFSQEKTLSFLQSFWSSFFYHLFCNLFLYRTHHLQDHPEKWSKHVFQSCVCMYTTPETIETFSENARCLDDASSAEIILLIQRVCITFFRISTQKALRATLLRGCFLVDCEIL